MCFGYRAINPRLDATYTALQSLTGPGAVSLTSFTTELITGDAGADSITLGDGYEGQLKFIALSTVTGGGDTSVLTPTSPLGFATITFNSAHDCAFLCFSNGGWYIIGVNGAVIG